jgi:hypothetical protein
LLYDFPPRYCLQEKEVLVREDGNWGCNLKAVSFVPLLARLAMELGLFEEKYRGGLLCKDRYTGRVPANCDFFITRGSHRRGAR